MTAPTVAPVVKRPAYLLVPLGVGALVSLALGVYGNRHSPLHKPLFGLTTTQMFDLKVWFTLTALVLALVQLLTALWMYGKLGVRAPRWTGTLHRTTGVLAFLVTLPVAFHCLWSIGFSTGDARTLAHSLFGCLFYGAFVAKVLTLHSRRVPDWALPWVAGALFTALVGVGFTSAVWWVVNKGFPG